MTTSDNQRKLSVEQVGAFHHTDFVADQIADFAALVPEVRQGRTITDVGGGCGYFAGAVAKGLGLNARVIDMDPASVEVARNSGVPATLGDALEPEFMGDEDVACFNLILHHLVGENEEATRQLQIQALRAWHPHARAIFVNEYIYQSFVGSLSGRMIYEITASPVLSAIGRAISRIVPAFKANTFGVGVRFRAHDEWLSLFEEAGYRVSGSRIGAAEPISKPLRVLLIKTIRRDSFMLEPIV
jgi:hypothetical protein